MMKNYFLIAALLCGAPALADSRQDALSFFAGNTAALTHLEKDAANGNVQASLQLGTTIYTACLDVPCDSQARQKYMTLAEKQGSQVPLALRLYQAAGDTKSTANAQEQAAQSLDRLAATSDDPDVWVYDGAMNINNHGPEKRKLGISLLARASGTGLAVADRIIASLYLQGIGVKRNLPQGLIWLSSAVKKGDPIAANDLGTAYQLGKYDLAINPLAAESTYRAGVALGCSQCAIKLSELLHARGKPADLTEAARLADRLAIAGSYYKEARGVYDEVLRSKGSATSFAALRKLADANQFGITFYVMAAGQFPQNADLKYALSLVKYTNNSLIMLPDSAVVAVRAALKRSGG